MANRNQFEPIVAPFRAGNIVIGLFVVLGTIYLVAAYLSALLAPHAHKASALGGTILIALGLSACGSTPPPAQMTAKEKDSVVTVARQHYSGTSEAVQGFRIGSTGKH